MIRFEMSILKRGEGIYVVVCQGGGDDGKCLVNDRYARENVLEARRLWEIYQVQHTVEIEKDYDLDYTAAELTLYHPGWYAVVID